MRTQKPPGYVSVPGGLIYCAIPRKFFRAVLQFCNRPIIINSEAKKRQRPGVAAPRRLHRCHATYTAAFRPHRTLIITYFLLFYKWSLVFMCVCAFGAFAPPQPCRDKPCAAFLFSAEPRRGRMASQLHLSRARRRI